MSKLKLKSSNNSTMHFLARLYIMACSNTYHSCIVMNNKQANNIIVIIIIYDVVAYGCDMPQ